MFLRSVHAEGCCRKAVRRLVPAPGADRLRCLGLGGTERSQVCPVCACAVSPGATRAEVRVCRPRGGPQSGCTGSHPTSADSSSRALRPVMLLMETAPGRAWGQEEKGDLPKVTRSFIRMGTPDRWLARRLRCRPQSEAQGAALCFCGADKGRGTVVCIVHVRNVQTCETFL